MRRAVRLRPRRGVRGGGRSPGSPIAGRIMLHPRTKKRRRRMPPPRNHRALSIKKESSRTMDPE